MQVNSSKIYSSNKKYKYKNHYRALEKRMTNLFGFESGSFKLGGLRRSRLSSHHSPSWVTELQVGLFQTWDRCSLLWTHAERKMDVFRSGHVWSTVMAPPYTESHSLMFNFNLYNAVPLLIITQMISNQTKCYEIQRCTIRSSICHSIWHSIQLYHFH